MGQSATKVVREMKQSYSRDKYKICQGCGRPYLDMGLDQVHLPADKLFLEQVNHAIGQQIAHGHFSVVYLAAMLHISVTHLNRRLNVLIGKSAGQCIRSSRLQKAGDLMTTEAWSMSQIAHKLGFSNQGTFSKSFKAEFGMSPIEYLREELPIHIKAVSCADGRLVQPALVQK